MRLLPFFGESGKPFRDRIDTLLISFFGFCERRRLGLAAEEHFTFGVVFIMTALSGGNCMMQGRAEIQNSQISHAISMGSGETDRRSPHWRPPCRFAISPLRSDQCKW